MAGNSGLLGRLYALRRNVKPKRNLFRRFFTSQANPTPPHRPSRPGCCVFDTAQGFPGEVSKLTVNWSCAPYLNRPSIKTTQKKQGPIRFLRESGVSSKIQCGAHRSVSLRGKTRGGCTSKASCQSVCHRLPPARHVATKQAAVVPLRGHGGSGLQHFLVER